MPEEVTSEPRVYKPLEQMRHVYRENLNAAQEISPDEYRRVLVKTRDDLVRRVPHLAREIQDVHDVAYNVLLVEEAEDRSEVTKKIQAARLQHVYVHNALFASVAYSSGERKDVQNYARNVYAVLEHSEKVATIFGYSESKNNAARFLTGAKAELAAIKALVDQDFPVYIPDYSQELDPNKLSENDVYQLDVFSGIDLFTLIERGDDVVAVLINIKGFSGVKFPRVRGTDLDLRSDYVRERIKEVGATRAVRAMIEIPTIGLGFGQKDLTPPIDYQREVGKYCDLPQGSKDAIVDGVENLARMELQRGAKSPLLV